MKTPIVLSAFGTTSRALDTYEFMDEKFKAAFPDHEIIWAYASRMVMDRNKKTNNGDFRYPHEVLADLKERGHEWAVVQSLHLMCGHEFYRLVDEAESSGMRTVMGLPLLSFPDDYKMVVEAMAKQLPLLDACRGDGEAVVMVGHGTDHPSWSAYLSLNHMFAEMFHNVWVGVVEEGYPDMEEIIRDVKDAGFLKVRLVPFMLTAGVHFEEDLAGEEDSWKSAFQAEGMDVALEPKGLGFNPGIVDVYMNHIEEALKIVPVS